MKLEFTQACAQLAQWTEQSQGQPIDIGMDKSYAFSREKLFMASEIARLQATYSVEFHPAYTYFLQVVGAARLFIGEYTAAVEFVALDKLQHWSAVVFENYGEDPFPQLLLCAGLLNYNFYAGFDLTRAEGNFAFFYPDVDPEYWLEDADFVDFQAWVIHLVQSKGELYY